jgi:GNAT superfamily N-acetyltransferase
MAKSLEAPDTTFGHRGRPTSSFIVGDAYQNKGIASMMLRHLAFIARDAGISDLHAHTLPGNRRARAR